VIAGRRLRAAIRRRLMRLVPAGRRDWVEAIWAETLEVPPGPCRVAWRAGAAWLFVRETVARRWIGSSALFAAGSALVAWAAWPGVPGGYAAAVDLADVITLLLVLAGLSLLAGRIFGPVGDGRIAKVLRVGAYAAILALIPAKNVVEQILDVQPRGGIELRLYRLISGPGFGNDWAGEALFLTVMALYAAAILWMTAQRSRVASATLAIGTGAGIAVGALVYAIVPLGVSNAATNPWLPGSDADPLVLSAWILLLFAPLAAGVVAYRRHAAAAGPRAPARTRQIVAAGVLTNLISALFVIVTGTGTIAAMLKAAWLRNWIYRGHPLAGVSGLRLLVRGNPAALAYSHEITAAVDAPPFLIVCVTFPLIAFALTGLGALIARGNAAPGPADPPPGNGGPHAPEVVPDPPDGAQLTGPQPVTTST